MLLSFFQKGIVCVFQVYKTDKRSSSFLPFTATTWHVPKAHLCETGFPRHDWNPVGYLLSAVCSRSPRPLQWFSLSTETTERCLCTETGVKIFTHYDPVTNWSERMLVSELVRCQSCFCVRIIWEVLSKYILWVPFRFIWIKLGGYYFHLCFFYFKNFLLKYSWFTMLC